MTQNASPELVEKWMLTGREFTYMDAYLTLSVDRDESRLIDRTIQRLRRSGRIAYRKDGSKFIWKAAP